MYVIFSLLYLLKNYQVHNDRQNPSEKEGITYYSFYLLIISNYDRGCHERILFHLITFRAVYTFEFFSLQTISFDKLSVTFLSLFNGSVAKFYNKAYYLEGSSYFV